MQKYVEQVDRETGEVMQGCMVYLPYRPRITERWFMAFQDSFEEIAKDPKVGRSKCYRLNPNYGWKGKVKTLQEARREQLRVIEGGKE